MFLVQVLKLERPRAEGFEFSVQGFRACSGFRVPDTSSGPSLNPAVGPEA